MFGDNKLHIEKCRGNAQSNIEYCKKDNNYFEHGTPKTGG